MDFLFYALRFYGRYTVMPYFYAARGCILAVLIETLAPLTKMV